MKKLERYNQILLAVVGTLVGLGMGALLVLFLAETLREKKPEGVVVAKEKAERPQQNLVFCPPTFAEGSQFQYMPVAVVNASDSTKSGVLQMGYGIKAMSYSTHGRSCGFNYGANAKVFNVVVRNSQTDVQRLLLGEPGQVDSLSVPSPKCTEGEGQTPCGLVLWTIRMRDTNNDGIINRDDALVAYVSDLSASNLTALTPLDATVLFSLWSAPSDEFLFQVRRDVNGDGSFTEEDGSEILGASSKYPQKATTVVSQKIFQELSRAVQ